MTENSDLPVQRQIPRQTVDDLARENRPLVQQQNFTALLNAEVESEKLRDHPFVKDVKYLPIGVMQILLDELFFGQWETCNFRWQQIGNEIVGAVDLKVFNPISKQWLTRTGAGAIQIMVDSFPDPKPNKNSPPEVLQEYNTRRNRWALNPDNKKPAALSNGGFAALEAFCFKNAALTIGKKFGRDVNREFYDNFEKWVTSIDTKINAARKLISDILMTYEDTDKQEIIDMILQREDEGTNTPDFYNEILKRLGHGNNL